MEIELYDQLSDEARRELHALLDRHPATAPLLLDVLARGNLCGSHMRGLCRCVYGWAFTAETGLTPLYSDSEPPDIRGRFQLVGLTDLEVFVFAVKPGHTPDNHPRLHALRGAILAWQAGT